MHTKIFSIKQIQKQKVRFINVFLMPTNAKKNMPFKDRIQQQPKAHMTGRL